MQRIRRQQHRLCSHCGVPLRQRVEIIRRGLEDFINILLTQPPTAGDEAVCAFLQIPAVAALHGLVWMMARMHVCTDECARERTRTASPNPLNRMGKRLHVDHTRTRMNGQGVRDDPQYSPPPVPQQQAPMTTPPLQQRPEGSEGTGAGMVSASELRMTWEAVESQQSVMLVFEQTLFMLVACYHHLWYPNVLA